MTESDYSMHPRDWFGSDVWDETLDALAKLTTREQLNDYIKTELRYAGEIQWDDEELDEFIDQNYDVWYDYLHEAWEEARSREEEDEVASA